MPRHRPGGIEPWDSRWGLQVDESSLARVAERVVGRRIVGFERDPDPRGDEWVEGQNSVRVILDDGSRLEFVAWGYDAAGVESFYVAQGDTDA